METLDPGAEITHRTLKNQQGAVFRDLNEKRHVVAIRNRSEIDGFLLAPSIFRDLCSRAEDADRMLAALPLLLAAAKTGIMIPSETFRTLGIGGEYDWEALNRLLTAIPVTVTHGEDGHQLPDASAVELRHDPVEELDEDLIVVE